MSHSTVCDSCLRGEDDVEELNVACNECLAEADEDRKKYALLTLRKVLKLLVEEGTGNERVIRYVKKKIREVKKEGS